MGMGEPFENYDEVLKAILLLNDPNRLNLSQRRITVSTVGVIEGIRRFVKENLKVNLVLSLHAPNQHIRKKIIPYARKYPLEEIVSAMVTFAKESKRDITYEYTLIEGINDLPEHAHELGVLLRGQPCTVNLIPYNPVPGLSLQRPEKQAIEEFRSILTSYEIVATWRYTKGKDIAAACGQLALLKKSKMNISD
jgi:23S rRNA (adenine2503-C2)-methyltransferase